MGIFTTRFGTSLKHCNRQLKSALEAVVDIIIPQDLPESRFLTILRSQGMERFAIILMVIIKKRYHFFKIK